MAEAPVATSTPENESSYHRRQQERAQRFLFGGSRAAYRLDPELERSLSTSLSDTSHVGDPETADDEDNTARTRRQIKRTADCKRGCPNQLERLAKTYDCFGKHTGKTAQYRRQSYPNPTQYPGKPPRNITGKITINLEIVPEV